VSYYALGALALPSQEYAGSVYNDDLAALDAEIGALEDEAGQLYDVLGAFWQSKEKRKERKRMRKRGYWKPVGAHHYQKKPLLLRKPGKAVKKGWHKFWRGMAPSLWYAGLKKERKRKIKQRHRKKSRRTKRRLKRMEEKGFTVTGVGAISDDIKRAAQQLAASTRQGPVQLVQTVPNAPASAAVALRGSPIPQSTHDAAKAAAQGYGLALYIGKLDRKWTFLFASPHIPAPPGWTAVIPPIHTAAGRIVLGYID